MDGITVGEMILGLHRNLAELRRNAEGNPQLQGSLNQAEEALRAQAREFLAAAAASTVAGLPPPPPQPKSGFRRKATSRDASPQMLARQLPGSPKTTWAGIPASPAAQVLNHARAESHNSPKWTRPTRPHSRGARYRSKTSEAQRILPRANRLDPLTDPPHLTEKDLDRGLLNLTEAGFIPASADLTPALERGVPVMLQKPAPLYDQGMKRMKYEIAPADHLLSLKLDASMLQDPGLPPRPTKGPEASRALVPVATKDLPPPMPSDSFKEALPALPPPPAIRDAAHEHVDQGRGGIAASYGTFCTELLDTGEDDHLEATSDFSQALVPVQPAGPSPEEIAEGAATTISAAWRALQARRLVAQLRLEHGAARRIQSAWAAALTRVVTKMEIQRLHQEKRQLHMARMEDFAETWFHTKQMKKVEVHLCSLTTAEVRRGRCDSYQALQAAQICRIFRLLDSKRDVIFVAPRQLHEDILDYYSKIMQFRGIKNPPGRFQVVVPENMGLGGQQQLSLSQGLLCSPKALKRLRKLISQRPAYLVPDVTTHTELKVSTTLGLPLFGPVPSSMAPCSSKSHGKKLALEAELPIGPWAVDIFDEDEFFASLAGLMVKHPAVRTWLFKIDDERDGRGLCYFDTSKIREVLDAVNHGSNSALGGASSADPHDQQDAVAASRHAASQEPTCLGADATELRQVLRRQVPKKATLCNRVAYPNFSSWLEEATRVGCVIQAVPEDILAQTSVHLQIDPDGSVNVLGTSEAISNQPFVRAASFLPHTRGDWQVLNEVGARVGRALAGSGAIGFASVDVVFFQNPNFDPSYVEPSREDTPMVIGGETPVDPRHLMFDYLRSPSPSIGSEAGEGTFRPTSSQLRSLPESRLADYELALQLKELEHNSDRARSPNEAVLHPDGPSPSSPYGCWIVDIDVRLTDEAANLFPLMFTGQLRLDAATGEMKQIGGGDTAGETDDDSRTRWACVSRVSMASGLDKVSHQGLFQSIKMRGISFDLSHNIGSIFTCLDIVHSLSSILAIDQSPEAAAKRLSNSCGAVLDTCAQRAREATAKSKVTAPRDLKMAESDMLSVVEVQAALRSIFRR